MSKTFYNVITLASLASLLHCAYSAAQHRSYLRLTEQPFVSLPADVLAQTIISLVALIYGATHVAGAFQHIKSDPNRDRSWDEAASCMSFITFEHRGKAMSPAHAVVRQRTEEVALVRFLSGLHFPRRLSTKRLNTCKSNNYSNICSLTTPRIPRFCSALPYSNQTSTTSTSSSSTVSSNSSSSQPDFSHLPGARQPKTKPTKPARVLEITHKQAQDAFDHCLELVRTRDKDNYQAVLTMPKGNRPELIALLAFNVELAMVREKIRPQFNADTTGLYRLQFWRDAIKSIYGESTMPVPRQPVAIALCAFAPRASLPLLDSLVVARQQSIGDRPFKTVGDLSAYGKATTGALVCLQAESLARECAVITPPHGVVKAANELGAAYGIMNLVRSSLPLMAQGIVLLPADLLTLHSLTADKVYNKKNRDAVVALVKDLVQVASSHLAASRTVYPSIPRALCPSLAAPASVIEYIIRNVKKAKYDLYDPRLQRRSPFLMWSLLYKHVLGRY
ncbi:hypothetical protein ANCCAN_21904 [Ancylostoma caninum]|uniref:Squalene/phytoene synthase n=1 Tax=Ancylostoma caninum TaxID=29170 RepID=A0A368FNB6_ANCCA|nr:hypothetical protein ANCCAN_21904 [Ancylostoma caninum]